MRIEDLYGMLELLTSKQSEYINCSSIVMDGRYSAWQSIFLKNNLIK